MVDARISNYIGKADMGNKRKACVAIKFFFKNEDRQDGETQLGGEDRE